MTQLIDKQGISQEVPPDKVQDALLSGQYAYPGNGIPVKDPNGNVGNVTAEQFRQVVQDGGRIATPEEYHQAAVENDLQARQEKLPGYGQAKAFGQGLLESVPFAEPIADKIGDVLSDESDEDKLRDREVSRLAQEQHKGFGYAGQAVGYGAQIAGLLTGATEAEGVVGVGARVAGAPLETIGLAGDAAEQATSRALAKVLGDKATSALGKFATRGAAKAVGTGTEGAIYGGAQYLNDEALQDHPDYSAEKLWAAMGEGAKWGALFGVGSNVAGELAQAGGKVLKEAGGRVSPYLDNLADKSLIAHAGIGIEEAREAPGGLKALTETMQSSGIVQAGDSAQMSAVKAEQASKKAGQQVVQDILSADAEGALSRSKYAPTRTDILDSIKESSPELAKKVEDYLPKDSPQVAFTPKGVMQTKYKEELGFAKTGQIIDKLGLDVQNAPPEMARELRDTQLKLQNLVKSRALKAAEGDTVPANVASKIQNSINEADRIRLIQDSLQKRADKLSNSPRDFFTGTAALGALATGHIHAAGALYLKKAITAQIRDRGLATAGVLLDKLSALTAVERSATRVELQTKRGIGAVLGKDGAAPVLHEPSKEMVGQVLKAAANPDQFAQHIDSLSKPITPHTPRVATAFKLTAMKSLAYLASKIPPGPKPDPLVPQFHEHEMSSMQMDKFTRIVRAVQDPPSVLANISKGISTADERDAIIATHPIWYQQTCAQMKKELAETKKPLSPEKMQAIRVFLGVPLIPLQTQQALAASQHTPVQKPAPQGSRLGRPLPQKNSPAQQVGLNNKAS